MVQAPAKKRNVKKKPAPKPPAKPDIRMLPIGELKIDGDTQQRVAIDEDKVNEYAERYEAGVKMPCVVVFYDGVDYWLVDGFHRRLAVLKVGRETIGCVIRKGTLEEARWDSYSRNTHHGLPRSPEDKQKSVTAAMRHPKGKKLSDRQIAEHCGVSHPFVGKIRKQLESTGNVTSQTTRKGRDGRTIDTSNIGAKPANEVIEMEKDGDEFKPTVDPTEGPLTVAPSTTAVVKPVGKPKKRKAKASGKKEFQLYDDCETPFFQMLDAVKSLGRVPKEKFYQAIGGEPNRRFFMSHVDELHYMHVEEHDDGTCELVISEEERNLCTAIHAQLKRMKDAAGKGNRFKFSLPRLRKVIQDMYDLVRNASTHEVFICAVEVDDAKRLILRHFPAKDVVTLAEALKEAIEEAA